MWWFPVCSPEKHDALLKCGVSKGMLVSSRCSSHKYILLLPRSRFSASLLSGTHCFYLLASLLGPNET